MKIRIFDCGEQYADRWEVHIHAPGGWDIWRMSGDACAPNGVCIFAGSEPIERKARQAETVPVQVAAKIGQICAASYSPEAEILAEIHAAMDGQEWDSDTAAAVAELLDSAGYVIREVEA